MLEHIVLIVAAILAVLFIIRTIIKISKGEDPRMFCKSCGDDKQDACCALKNDGEKKTGKSSRKKLKKIKFPNWS